MKSWLLFLVPVLTLGCTPLARERAKTVDDYTEKACELLAQENADRMGVDPDQIIDAVCRSRDFLDQLLSTQAAGAAKAGVGSE